MTCQRTYAKTKNQIMANLPASRVTLAVPFSGVGIDLAGPVFVRRGHTRKPTFDRFPYATPIYLCQSKIPI